MTKSDAHGSASTRRAAAGDWIGYYLNQLAARIRDATAASLQPLGLTPAQFRALETIAAHQPLSQAHLGELTALDRTTVVAFVDALEGAGAVKRNRDPQDRRSHALMVTASGERLLSQGRELAQAAEESLLAPLSPRERSTLRSLLVKLHQPSTCDQEKRR